MNTSANSFPEKGPVCQWCGAPATGEIVVTPGRKLKAGYKAPVKAAVCDTHNRNLHASIQTRPA